MAAAVVGAARAAPDGCYEVEVRVPAAGRYWLSLLLDEQRVGAGPVVLQVAPGAAASVQLLDLDGLPQAGPLRAQAVDSAGNVLLRAALTATATCTDVRVQLPATRARARVAVQLLPSASAAPLVAAFEFRWCWARTRA